MTLHYEENAQKTHTVRRRIREARKKPKISFRIAYFS